MRNLTKVQLIALLQKKELDNKVLENKVKNLEWALTFMKDLYISLSIKYYTSLEKAESKVKSHRSNIGYRQEKGGKK